MGLLTRLHCIIYLGIRRTTRLKRNDRRLTLQAFVFADGTRGNSWRRRRCIRVRLLKRCCYWSHCHVPSDDNSSRDNREVTSWVSYGCENRSQSPDRFSVPRTEMRLAPVVVTVKVDVDVVSIHQVEHTEGTMTKTETRRALPKTPTQYSKPARRLLHYMCHQPGA